jgi:hypothetical protein
MEQPQQLPAESPIALPQSRPVSHHFTQCFRYHNEKEAEGH